MERQFGNEPEVATMGSLAEQIKEVDINRMT